MEEHCSTGQSPQRAVALMEEEEEEYFKNSAILYMQDVIPSGSYVGIIQSSFIVLVFIKILVSAKWMFCFEGYVLM